MSKNHEQQPPGDVSQDDSPPRKTSGSVPIVAIGASAGGLDALKAFFAHMPDDPGIGFVVITHVSPERESILPELIADVTDLEVLRAEEGMRVEPNRIVVGKDSLLRIADGRLGQEPPDEDEGDARARIHYPIDHFFRALADDRGERSICVVLSGSGKDGTLGLRAIKAAGGMAMVQSPESAKYAGMPDSARATGLADYVLSADELPDALVKYCRGPYLSRDGRTAPRLPDDAINAVLVRLRSHTGQDFTSYKKSTMSRRIERRMAVHKIERPQDYVAYIRDNPAELDTLLGELLISVTRFFRDPEAFEALSETAIPAAIKQHDDGDTLRVWVPGCATGEEAYSVAILLHEQIRHAERMHDVQMFATDLDEAAIDVARAGVYPESISADVSEERLAEYFTKEGDAYRVSKKIRDMVVFAVQNVTSDPPFTRIDLIVCRNLLIYLEPDAQSDVLRNFHYALQPGGLLFLGASETVGESSDLFEAIDSKNRILRRREIATPVLPTVTRPTTTVEAPTKSPSRSVHSERRADLTRTVERLLLEEFAPCSVVVDSDNIAVYFHGIGGTYFQPEQGVPRNDVIEMARPGLKAALSSALRNARKENAEQRIPDVSVQTNGQSTTVDVTARPMDRSQRLDGHVLVTILPSASGDGKTTDSTSEQTTSAQGEAAQGDHDELQRELMHTRESLQSTIEELETRNEELRSSNEELQSTNEELQSTNEELETAKEEMQALNEELSTVNAELSSKVDALARANDDMNNLLNSTQVATVFLDRQLRVKRYTQKATEVIRLIHSDLGRPLADINMSIEYPDLTKDCGQVLDSLVAHEQEVQDEQGRWHLVRLLPYRTAEDVIEGLVITIVDIDRAKRAERAGVESRISRDFFRSIVQTARNPLLVLDDELNVLLANDAFHRTFRTREDETIGKRVYDLGNKQWDIPELRKLLEEILPENNTMKDFRVHHEFPWIGQRTFLLNAERLQQADERDDLVLLAFEDRTETDDE